MKIIASIRVFIFFGALVGGAAIGYAGDGDATKKEKPRLLAEWSDDKLDDGYRQLFIYSKQKLEKVEYRVGRSTTWSSMTKALDRDGYFTYHTSPYQNTAKGATYQIKALDGSTQFIEQLEVTDEKDGKPRLSVAVVNEAHIDLPPPSEVAKPEEKSSTPAEATNLDQQSVFYGAAHLDAQVVAQGRADFMAVNHNFDHLGSGYVSTRQGRLAEGIGWGSGTMPSTCVASNGSAAIADAHAVAGDGSIYRVRLYNSPATTNGGGGSHGGRRHRGWRRR